jgi:hypothetical protein
VLLACLTTFFMADQNPRYVFLVGILPALLVFWIRRHVPEPAEWHSAKRKAQGNEPSVLELFRGEIRRTTLLTIVVCACSLSAWWAFMFWNQQHMRNLPDIAAWPVRQKEATGQQFVLSCHSFVDSGEFLRRVARRGCLDIGGR